jgi:Domain of unknown function (DUF4350)
MLTARNAILIALAVFMVSLVAGTFSLMGPPDSDGAAVDSYGTRRDGFRAAYELLKAFDVTVERRIEPPSPQLPTLTTLVLWVPHDDLVANEPAYLERLIPWVERGGRLVVAVPPRERNSAAAAMRANSGEVNVDIFSTFKLENVQSIAISLKETNHKKSSPKPPLDIHSETSRQRQIRRSLEEAIGMHPIQFTTSSVAVSGSFDKLRDRVQRLQIPDEEIGGLKIGEAVKTSGKIECEGPGGEHWTIAAAFQRGQGEIVVVAEPMLLMNASLGQADNGAFAYDLLADGERHVLFDEFYHGLSVRGNPLWLLTKSTYATVAMAILVLLSLELWRRAIVLGPPLEPSTANRRTIIEYIEAMARFLNRGRGCRPFVLREVRAGVLRTIGGRFGISQAAHDPEVIASTMAKRSPQEADQFRQGMNLIDAALRKGDSLSESEAVRVLQRISRCL